MTVKQYLQASGVSVPEFAKRVGVHRATVFRWLQGGQPKPHHLGRIITATGGKISAEELLCEAERKAG